MVEKDGEVRAPAQGQRCRGHPLATNHRSGGPRESDPVADPELETKMLTAIRKHALALGALQERNA